MIPMPAPAPGAIDLWLAFYDRIDEASLAQFARLLSEDEHARQARFRLADDRRRYLAARGTVRTVLSRYADVAPAQWTFRADAHGRPRIDERHGQACRLSFNLSHTRGLIALAVAAHGCVGVDAEHIGARPVPAGMAERYFAPHEVADLASLPAHRREDRFCEYWTLKEAYVKARGLGLSIPLDRFGFRFADGLPPRLAADPAFEDDAGRWRFWQHRPTPDHLLAVCADAGASAPLRVEVRTLAPPSAAPSGR